MLRLVSIISSPGMNSNKMACTLAAQNTLGNDTSGYETSSESSIPMDNQPPAARQKNVTQGTSKDDSDDELGAMVSGPRQPNSIKLAATKNRM